MRDRAVLLAIFDTATGATLVDPWGKEMQRVFANLRVMLAEYPELAIVLLIHLKKPSGRGDRRISDVLGEWGRWSDVVVLMENEGKSLTRTKISVRKRVRHERRIIVTKRGGLLVDSESADGAQGRLGAYVLHSRYDSRELTKAAHAAAESRFERERLIRTVSCRSMSRLRRADMARKAFFTRVALKSAQARRKRARPDGPQG